MRTMILTEEWPGKDNWMKKKPLGMGDLLGRTSERHYNKQTCIQKILDNLSPNDEESIAKNLPIDNISEAINLDMVADKQNINKIRTR